MSKVIVTYPPPANWQDFQRLCLSLLRVHWNRPGLDLFGKEGEAQDGIDILDLQAKVSLHTAQCKRKNPLKGLRPKEIEAEVRKVRAFTPPANFPPVKVYWIMTTAKSSRAAQPKAAQLTAENATRGLFVVEVKGWDQIAELLNQYPEVARMLSPDIGGDTVARLEKVVEKAAEKVETAVSVMIEARSDDSALSTGRSFDGEIDEARNCLEKHEYEVAEHSLVRIRERVWDQLSPRQRFRVLSNLAMAKLARGEPTQAASPFHRGEDSSAGGPSRM